MHSPDLYPIPFSTTPHTVDLPLSFDLDQELLDEIKKPLNKLIQIQEYINSTYTREDYVELMKINNDRHTLYAKDHHIVNMIYYCLDGSFGYFIMHNIETIDTVKIHDLIAKSIGIDPAELRELADEYNSNNPTRLTPDVYQYFYIDPNFDMPYHIHSSRFNLRDSTNFLIPVNGHMTLKTRSVPMFDPVIEDVRPLSTLTAINHKKYHSGTSIIDNTFVFYFQPKLPYPKVAELHRKKYPHLYNP